jgi:hypothetical protein
VKSTPHWTCNVASLVLWEALVTGRVDLRRVWVLLGGTAHLTDPVARRVVDDLIDDAPRLTTGQLAGRLRRACFDIDPDDAALRYRHAVEERRVVTEPTPDGAANLLGLDLPAELATAAAHRITHLARQLRRNGETRTMDQLRADVFLDLLTGTTTTTATSGPAVGVELTAPLTTLAGLPDEAGEIRGFGPVIADVARQIADQQQDAQWRFTVTHPHSGEPLHLGVTRRRPNGDHLFTTLLGHHHTTSGKPP